MAITSKERMLMLLSGEIPDRIAKADAPWPETRARWAREGLPADVHASDYFKMDMRMNFRTLPTFQFPETVVEETDEFQVVSDADGGVTKFWKNKSGVPLPLKNAVESRQDWEAKKHRLAPSEDRFAFGYYGNYMDEYVTGTLGDVKAAYDACETIDETFVTVEVADPYEFAMAKMGDERLLMKMIMEPDLITDMLTAYADFTVANCELFFDSGIKVDGVFLGGDIAYKNGLLFSPEMHRELIFPHLVKIIDYLKRDRGLRIVYHTDGNPTQAIPLLVEAGIDCLEPMEVNAGMDVRALAGQWGERIAFMGNISAAGLSGPKDKLAEEVRSKIEACKAAGARYIIHSDHSVPDTVSFENFSFYMDLVEKYGAYN